MPYISAVRTVAETPIFQRYATEVWNDGERIEFINWIAAHPSRGFAFPSQVTPSLHEL
ncbi:MAG: hypothetical protein K1X51_17765 [Rhodospirillaceae bacterium]|nr:hypothetical protein [Rhodospirillaceae bacterium]